MPFINKHAFELTLVGLPSPLPAAVGASVS